MTFEQIQQQLEGSPTRLVAVSKTKPVEAIQGLYERGQRLFGESKVQELVEKYEALPKDIEWHLIGHLQTNKVKYVAPFVHMIHSLDSYKLLKEINKRAKAENRIIRCLLQFKIAEEDTKYGFELETAREMLTAEDFPTFQNVQIAGVMGMATFTEDEQQVREEFQSLVRIFDLLKDQYFPEDSHFREISMGMSGDYAIAMEEGSTLVRIGTLLFGERNYA